MVYELLVFLILGLLFFHILKLRKDMKELSKLTSCKLQTILDYNKIDFPNEELFDESFKQRVIEGLINDPKMYVMNKTGCSGVQADRFIASLSKKKSEDTYKN